MNPQPGELAARMAIVKVVERRQIRYAHMVGVTPEIMQQLRPRPKAINCSGRRTGNLRRSNSLVRLKMAVLAPIPIARVRTATHVKPGDLPSIRRARRQSEKTESSQLPMRPWQTISVIVAPRTKEVLRLCQRPISPLLPDKFLPVPERTSAELTRKSSFKRGVRRPEASRHLFTEGRISTESLN